MGLFSRLKSAATRIVERVASTVERAAARVLDRMRPVVAEKSAPRAPAAPPPPPPAAEERAALAERLGPVIAELEPDQGWDREAIELDQWFAFLDDAQEHLPEGFAEDFRRTVQAEGFALDDELITSMELDAPTGATS